MGDNIFNYENTTSIACSSSAQNHHSDEISLFLRQILVGSSSSSPSSPTTHMAHHLGLPQGQSFDSFSSSLPENPGRPSRSSRFAEDGITAVDCCSDVLNTQSRVVLSSSGGAFFSENVRGSAANVSSSSVGASENETEEYDCESEEGLEAFADELPAKPAPSRSSSKRSRAAEVHNLSEKRRRSRINEKMKALQNLIPNSNKTDKASMLDEAIEYLKQLQLQVQMLSMRNGFSLHPMCLPGMLPSVQLSQIRMDYGEENTSLHMHTTTGTLPMNQENQRQTALNLPNQGPASNPLSVPNISNLTNLETSFGLDLSIPAHFGPFQPHPSSEVSQQLICRESTLPHQQLIVSQAEANPSGSSMVGREQHEGVVLNHTEGDLVLPPHLTGLGIARSGHGNNIKMERQNL